MNTSERDTAPTSMRRHRQLRVWQRAMDLLVESYRIAKRLPPSERFELAAQIRRAAASVPANIAEGYARVHRGDYVRHLSFARGSVAELETHFDACERIGFMTQLDLAQSRDLADHVGRMLTSMIVRLRPPTG